MNKSFYPTLAFSNIKKNRRTYFPYILTCIFTTAMFFMMHSIAASDLSNFPGTGDLTKILMFGTIIIAIFAAIFLFYTNSFLMKQRKKEIALYNILGMGKKHIALMLAFEVLFIAAIALIVGIGSGILLQKLMFMLLQKILGLNAPIPFAVSGSTIAFTLVLFGAIFLLTLLSNLLQITIASPIALLYGGKKGEKEPKTKWILAILGFLCLGAGYFLVLYFDDPLAAIVTFFFAVILVIIGTYCLFTAGSIALLKGLRKNKNFYYKTKHFTAVSGMIYRMKQNAVGLANICILSTMVLVMLSGTVSLYIGKDDAIETRFPRSIMLDFYDGEEARNEFQNLIATEAGKFDVTIKNRDEYTYLSRHGARDGENFIVNAAAASSAGFSQTYLYYFIPLADYNRITKQSHTLAADEVLLYANRTNHGSDQIVLDGLHFRIKEELDSIPMDNQMAMLYHTYYIIVDSVDTIHKINDAGLSEEFLAERTEEDITPFPYAVQFDVDGEEEACNAFSDSLHVALRASELHYSIDSLFEIKDGLVGMYGSFLFLGMFLGALFIMATVLIIYYKQISEGYDDKERFDIMQKVGMSKKEVRATIRSQSLMVFFLPLIVAVIHICVAFPVIKNLLLLLNLFNGTLYLVCTIVTVLIFAAVYAIVYMITARTYYKIVK